MRLNHHGKVGLEKVILFLMVAGFYACNPKESMTKETDTIAERVDSLISLMTLEEKIGQTNMYSGTWEFTGPVPEDRSSQQRFDDIKEGRVGAMLNVISASGTREAQELAVNNSRLGIPLLFGYDVIHGYQTMLPIPLAQSASWDLGLAATCSRIAAREASAAGIHWTFAPMVDISRDSRWGRIMESPGEDPFLASLFSAAWVDGFQGANLAAKETVAACAKHYVGYGFAEAGRDYNSVELSNQTLYNVVLPPFFAAKEAGVATFMSAFNDLNGTPATASTFLLRKLLKDQWGFEGLVVSDWGSIGELRDHGFVADTVEAAQAAMNAGTDMDMESVVYLKRLKKAIEKGWVEEKTLDEAVRRILTLKFHLGLFDDPYRYCDTVREGKEVYSSSNREKAREVARETMVLLKNEEQLLPLEKDIGSIAVIGQLAAHKDIPLGSWRAQAIPNSAVSLLEGIKAAAGEGVEVQFAEGYRLVEGRRSFTKELNLPSDDRSGFAEALDLARRSDVVIMAMGEDCFQSGEGRSQVDIQLKGNQVALLQEIAKVNSNIVVVLMTGRPVAIPEVAKVSRSLLQAWYAGSESGHAVADVLFGDYNPAGKLTASFPYHSGQEPLYYSRKSTGRPEDIHNHVFWSHYTDSPNEALFPFGYGLSYTTFSYSKLQVQVQRGQVQVVVEVKNGGDFDGAEVVQLYIRDVAASLTRPILELKGFEKIYLEKGDLTKVKFTLTKEDLSFFNNEGEKVFEPGKFVVAVGTSSADLVSKTITLE